MLIFFRTDFYHLCVLQNPYFRFISSLEDANVPLPNIEHKTNNFLRDIVIITEEIIDIIKKY
jgi:hypothetical protein